ncbi:TonB-dependent receptor [Sphingobacterium sp. SGG-5]|uniref:TonB-dependent receptor n=1 Tax=Sphingobacterium sp. SGG-5 TaxID=2710881 RepID=UPI001F118A71|nr:TonB-dependent receptor [Sphingobacterium sp. SGG-5]
MKLTTLLLLISGMHLSANSLAQKVTLKVRNSSLKEVFKELNKQTGYYFIYNEDVLKSAKPVTVALSNVSLDKALMSIFHTQPLRYAIDKNTLIITKDDNRADAQQEEVVISGRIYDTNEPPNTLSGVSVAVKGTTIGTKTDQDGNFSITVPKGTTLLFSITGFLPLERTFRRDQRNISLSLEAEISALEEVVVVGMTEMQKKHMASAVSSLNMESNVAGKPITSLGQALQGGVTGIQVNQGSGTPGGDAVTIRIRGITTLNNSNPLVLVDGLPMDMNNIDPVTIESVTVLKDAAAASIYGARAANGVILVTTKRGVPGKMNVAYDGYYAVATPTVMPRTVDAPRYMQMFNEAEQNSGNAGPFTQEVIDKTRSGEDPLNYPNTNWMDLMIRQYSPLTSNSLSVTGGNDLARFAITGNYMNQQGMLPKSGYKRLNFRANTSISFGKKFDVKLDLLAIRRNVFNQPRAYRLIEDIYRVPPNILPRYPDRSGYAFYGQYADIVNPIAWTEQGGKHESEQAQSSLNLQPRWEVLPNLNLRGQISFRLNSDAEQTTKPNFVHYDYNTFAILREWAFERSAKMGRTAYYFVSASADYTWRKGNHYLFGMAGYTQEENNSGNWNIYSLMSGFGKVNYSYQDKYLFEGTARTDGSSRFGPNNKFGFFPSVAVGWNLHNESFMRHIKAINNLKLRLSYGRLGNENIAAYLYQSLINTSNGLETSHGNPDITWETVDMLNAGVDLGLFKQNKIELTFDYYDKLTKDIILSPTLPLAGGFERATPINAGRVRNRGIEFSVNYNERFSRDFRLSFRPGITYNKNTIERLVNGPYVEESATRIHQEGYSIGSVYGYQTAGLLQERDFDEMGNALIPITTGQKPGDIRYLDLSGNGIIDDADQGQIGNPTPEINYFGNVTLNYKNFDLDFLVQGTGKSDATLLGMFALPLDQSFDGGVPTTFYDGRYWTPERTDARFPRLNTNPTVNKLSSDFWFQNGAYLRVKYIQLGYNVKKSTLRKIGVSGVRVYLNAQNPFTFTSVELTDPESRGNQRTYSITKLYSIGARVNF